MDKNIIKKHLTLLSEDKKPVGLSSTEKVQAQSKKSNDEYQKDVKKEMEAYEEPLKPEGEPVKYENSEKEETYHNEMEIMNGQEMIEYDNDPGTKFQERAEKAIAGDPTMGNSGDWANVIPADQAGFTGPEFGKNLVKSIKSSKKKRDDADIDNHYDNETTSVSAKNSIKGKKNNATFKKGALSENKIEKKEKMKRLVFKKEFKGIENALNVIPESYKIDGKEFHMTDGNEKYEIKWEGNLTEGRAVVLKASDKNLMTEDMQKMKHLMGYSSQDTLGTVKGAARLDENKAFDDVLNKTKNLLGENAVAGSMQGFVEEGDLAEGEEIVEESEEIEEGVKTECDDNIEETEK